MPILGSGSSGSNSFTNRPQPVRPAPPLSHSVQPADLGILDAYVLEPGTAGNNVSTPHNVAFDPAGDIVIATYIAPDDWTPGAAVCIASDWTSAANGSWRLTLNTTGFLTMNTSIAGVADAANATIAVPGVGDTFGVWLYWYRQASDGTVDFKYSYDTPATDPASVSWTNIQVNRASTLGTLTAPTADVHIGGFAAGVSSPFAGKIFRVTAYHSTAMATKIWDMRPGDWVSGTSWVSASTGETWTINGTASVVPAPSVGGVANTQTNTGSSTPTSVLTNATSKTVRGTSTPTGVTAKATSKTVVGSSTPTGRAIKATSKTVTGSSTPTGALARLFAKIPTGTSTPTGAQVRAVTKTVTGSSTPTGVATEATSKTLTGSSTPTGAITQLRVKLQTLLGSITPVGAIVNAVAKTVAGSSTPTGVQARADSKTVSGSSTPTGRAIKADSKTVTGSSTSTGALAKAITKTLAGVITPTGSLRKAVADFLVGVVTGTGAIVQQFTAGTPTTGAVLPGPVIGWREPLTLLAADPQKPSAVEPLVQRSREPAINSRADAKALTVREPNAWRN